MEQYTKQHDFIMKIYKYTSSQHNGYVTDRKPTICPRGKKKEIKNQFLECLLKKYLKVVIGISQAVFQIFQSIEFGAAVIVRLPF